MTVHKTQCLLPVILTKVDDTKACHTDRTAAASATVEAAGVYENLEGCNILPLATLNCLSTNPDEF